VTQGSFSPFSQDEGKWGNYFDGSGDSISIATDSELDWGTSTDFTMECWFYSNISISANTALFDTRDTSDTAIGGFLGIDSSGNVEIFFNQDRRVVSSSTIQPNQWYHIAAVRNSGTLELFINGVSAGTDSTSLNIQNTSGITVGDKQLSISSYGSPTGYISNARVVSGTAVYTSAFTPPTEPLTAITNTSLLTCQSNRFVDNSSNAHAITVTGTPEVTPFSPFAPSTAYDPATKGGSGYFDGSDVLSAAETSGITITGSTDFCIEGWIYPTNISAVNGGIFQAGVSSGALAFRHNTNGTLRVLASGVAADLDTTATINENSWQHVAATRSGSTLRIFINGVEEASTTSSRDYADVSSSDELVIAGRYYSSAYQDEFYGYISDFRFVVGDAVYTSAFTPSTAPLTKTDSTVLLLNFTNAGIYDGTGRNVLETVGDAHVENSVKKLETVGDAHVENSVKKYGTGSMQFDGTGDILRHLSPSPVLALGTGDFTVEFWMYLNNTNTQVMFDMRHDSNSNTALTVFISSGFKFYAGTGLPVIGSVSTGQWYHIAIVRNNGTITSYLDGVAGGTESNTNDLTCEEFRIGARWDDASEMNGYIDDFRVTKGVARYTANFTPPAAKLPNL